MPLSIMLIIVACAWLLLLGATGVIEHMRLRRAGRGVGAPGKDHQRGGEKIRGATAGRPSTGSG